VGVRRLTAHSKRAQRRQGQFPETHNVYIEPGSYEIYKKAGEFPVVAIVSARIQAEDSAMSLQLGPLI
jgi:hypothetical protein